MVSVSTPISSASVFSFGNPFQTEAFVNSPLTWDWRPGQLPCGFLVQETGSQGYRVSIALEEQEGVVGLGQHVGPVNCRGQSFRLFNTDSPTHIPSLRSMYGSHPFMIILRDKPLGIFIDSPGEVLVDVGALDPHTLDIRVATAGFYLTVIEGESVQDIVSKHLALTGTPYIPPRWAFGYHQSRWSYPDEGSVREVAAKMQQHDIPCDVIHMDIHYMQDYKVFTVNKERFPDLPKLSMELKEQGIRLISILDPGVKAEPGFSVYDEGMKRDFFCRRSDGAGAFVGAVWPGPSVFPDFFRPDVRAWWGALYKPLKEQGIAGFWNDMNEPSIFYTPDAFKDFAQKVRHFDERNDFGEQLANTLWDKGVINKEEYYNEFTHTINGQQVVNREVHNLFGTQMTRAVADALLAEDPTKRYFLLSRSSYPGMHRYAAIWTGDNHSWWEHLSLNIQMLISLNLSGFLFCGADTGGFSGDCTAEMLVRWTQLSAFTPFFRNHAAMWAKNQEPWAFDDKTLVHCRAAIKMRYALLPYLYSEFIKSALHCEPFIRGLFLEFKEAAERLDDDQFLCGRWLLVAPVVKAATQGRLVYLPNGPWLKVIGTEQGLTGEQVQQGGDHFVAATLEEIPLFLRAGALIPMATPGLHTSAEPQHHYRLLGFTDSTAQCEILLDDGETRYDSWKSYPKLLCSVTLQDGSWSCSATFESAQPRPISLEFELWNLAGKRESLSFRYPIG